MGYSVKEMGKKFNDGKVKSALNIATHLKGLSDEQLAAVTTAYEALKAGATAEDEEVMAGIKEVKVMMGIENAEVKAVVENADANEEVKAMAENVQVAEEQAAVVAEVQEEAQQEEEVLEYDPWVYVTGSRKDKTALNVTIFDGDIDAKRQSLQREGYTFVCLSKVSAFNRFLGNNFKRSQGIVKNLEKKGVTDMVMFVTNILAYAIPDNDGATITINIEGVHEGQDTIDNEDGTVEAV